jgi:4-hydroxy-tetrahydrodipicolinate reductase
MVKIVITGAAGRMGRRLVALTVEDPGLELVGAVEYDGHPETGTDAGVLAGTGTSGILITSDLAAAVNGADAMIDFSGADVAVSNSTIAADADCAVVLGTTGLTDEQKAAVAALADRGRILAAPNMSVGVNLLFLLAGQVASTLDDSYDIEVVDMHHNQKKDAPSGTAERLGEILANARGYSYKDDTAHGREGIIGARPKREIGMHSLRGGDVVGDHTVIFATGGERVELTHKASSRDAFAKGALRAAKFLSTKGPGEYSMKDVLGL